MLRAMLKGVADLGAEPSPGLDRLAGEELAIEPGGAARGHLGLQRKVRAGGKGLAPAAVDVGPGSKLHDRAGLGVSGHVEVGEPQMVATAVDAIDHGIGAAA